MTPCDRYVAELVEAGCAVRLPELTRGPWPHALYRIRERRGVGVMALGGDSLSENQRDALLRFRFAQYLDVGFVDAELVHRERLEREPVPPNEPAAVNFVAFSSDDGRILASLSLRAAPDAPPGTTLHTRERPLLPFEEHFGWGALNRLRILPELPLGRIRELGRFVKNRRLGSRAELGARAVVEVCLAAFHSLTGPLRLVVEAFVGEFEDAVARRHLEFLHTPFAMVRGGLPAFEPGHFLRPALDGRARYPFAVLVSDMASMAARLRAVEAALAEPGTHALSALAAANERPGTASSLLPPGGLASLADTPLPQRDLSAAERRRARSLGARLRAFPPLASLSDTECTTLHGLLDELRVRPGTTVVARGERADALYLIERGEARVQGATLRRGDCFGEIGLLTGGPRTADVVASTPLRLLRMSRETYHRYLRPLPDVDGALGRLGLMRAAAQLQPS
jgi:Cyclic nucleotide-binding domain